MAINGQQNINIGTENQTSGSDSLYSAFNKVQNNFTILFNTSSPYNSFSAGDGINTVTNPSSGVVTITNTGVLSLSAGTGIALSGSNGEIIISASGNGIAGVTSVGVVSNTLAITNTPIVSSGNISVELPVLPTGETFAAGNYVAPTLTVDNYGRITAIANTVSTGTVTSIAIQAVGSGLSITGSPITSDGTIDITNTGVTKINAGTGIQVSGSTGEITISSTLTTDATVSRVDVTSNTLTVTGSPITSSGTINVELPANITLSNFEANSITANVSLTSEGTLDVTGNTTLSNANISLGRGNFVGRFDGIIGNTTPNAATFTTVTSNTVGANTATFAVGEITELTINDGGYIAFANAAGNYVALFSPPTSSDTIFVLPGSDGTPYGVLGTNGQANNVGYATLGWKTVVTQYLSVLLRNGVSTVYVPPDVVKRKQAVLLRDGTSYTDVTLY